MKMPYKPVFPLPNKADNYQLTVQELLAGMALQGILAGAKVHEDQIPPPEVAAKLALDYANALAAILP